MINHLEKRAWKILQAGVNVATRAKGYIEEMRVHVGYAEPGYGYDDTVIVTGNFNSVNGDNTPSRVGELLEKAGVEIEWSDEWANCSECNRLVRTNADSYCWTPSYVTFNDCEIVCEECVESDPEDHFRALEGNCDNANTLNINPGEHGYVKIGEDFERGYHPGQDADPKVIAAELDRQGLERYLFQIDNVGQFDTEFSVWLHSEELSELDMEAWEESEKDRASVSGALKRGLEEASKKMSELSGDGIKYASINADDSADVRMVSREEFVKGIDD